MEIIIRFLNYAEENDILLFAGDTGDVVAATLRNNDGYGIFFNMKMLNTRVAFRGAIGHEHGHCATGALRKANSPFELVEKNEETANRWYFKNYIPADAIQEALSQGYTEFWEMEEYLGFPEKDVRAALKYYEQALGYIFYAE